MKLLRERYKSRRGMIRNLGAALIIIAELVLSVRGARSRAKRPLWGPCACEVED